MSKKRKSKAFIRRSKASKKGWATRKRKQKELEYKAGIRARIQEKGVGKFRAHVVGMTPAQAKKKVAADKQFLKTKYAAKRLGKKKLQTAKALADVYEVFVTDADPSEIRTAGDAKGTIAHSSSRLRELPEKKRQALWEDIQAHESEPDFDLYMYDLADDYEVEIREVYTFFFSP